jgi:hypothetical protein
MLIGGTLGGHEVRATCMLQLGIDPTTSVPRPQDVHAVYSVVTAADMVLPRQVTAT